MMCMYMLACICLFNKCYTCIYTQYWIYTVTLIFAKSIILCIYSMNRVVYSGYRFIRYVYTFYIVIYIIIIIVMLILCIRVYSMHVCLYIVYILVIYIYIYIGCDILYTIYANRSPRCCKCDI